MLDIMVDGEEAVKNYVVCNVIVMTTLNWCYVGMKIMRMIGFEKMTNDVEY